MRLSRDLPGEPLSEEDCHKAIAEVFPVIELHHFVVPGDWAPGSWVIASSGMNAGFVLAEPESRGPQPARIAHNMCIRINDVLVGSAGADTPLVSPIESLRWLVGRLGRFGLNLCEGQIILTGSPMNLYPVAPGSRIVVDAPPLGSFAAIDV